MGPLIEGHKESSLSFYEKTKRVNEYLLRINQIRQTTPKGPAYVGNEFTGKIQSIINSMKSEIRQKKSKKVLRSRAKRKPLSRPKEPPQKENQRPVTCKAPRPKRLKNSRIKSNITKLEPKRSAKKDSKLQKNFQFHSRELHKRRIQSAYNGKVKSRKFRIKRKKGSVMREAHSNFDMRYHYSAAKPERGPKEAREDWKNLVDQENEVGD